METPSKASAPDLDARYDLKALVLGPFDLGHRKIHFLAPLGQGGAGYVFKVRIGVKEYAMKMVSQAF